MNIEDAPKAINELAYTCHQDARLAGWWDKERNPAEMIALMHSELSEMLEGVRKDRQDDHLPDRQNEEVEAADLLIRLLDYCGGRNLDLGGAFIEKRRYNRHRADHQPEARAAAGGKKF